MRYYEYQLNEYNRDITAKNYSSKIVAVARRDRSLPAQFRDPKAVTDEQLADLVLDQIEKSDPTKNKEYAQALAKIYTQGQTQFEDMGSTLADYLTKFHKLKLKKAIPPPRNDFMRYDNVADFMSVVDEYPDVEELPKDKGQAREVYKDADLRIIVPMDQAGACYYGQGTKWCTAARQNNMFDRYNKQGELYIIIPAKPSYGGEKYQFHFSSGQFMDEQDRPINVVGLLNRYPQLRKVFAQQAEEHGTVSFLYTPEQLDRLTDWFRPQMQQELANAFRDRSYNLARSIANSVMRSNKSVKDVLDLDEFTEIIDQEFQDMRSFARQVAYTLDLDEYTDEDNLYDRISDISNGWLDGTDIWAYVSELDFDEDLFMDAGMTLQGDFASVVQDLVKQIAKELFKEAKQHV